jgi:steroid delta-isomerase-like uncharacterized protein
MSAEENKALVRRVYEEFTNQKNLDVLDQGLVVDYVHHDPALPPEMQRGRDNYKQGIGAFHAAFPDLWITCEDQVAEADKVVSRWTVSGTQDGEFMGIPASGNRVSFSMITISRIEGGRIAESWVNFDALGMMQQLSVIPAPEQPAEA